MSEREQFDRTGAALAQATEELRAFSTAFLPKPAAAGAGEQGDAVLASQMAKQFLGYVLRAFPAPASRRALAEALEMAAAALRSRGEAGNDPPGRSRDALEPDAAGN